MELKYLRLQNFLSFKELSHTFVNEPVLIKGKNLTETESKETNGVGKSAMEAGIAFAILATPLRKQTLDKDLIRWGETECHIWLDIYCPIRNRTLNIHRTLRMQGSQLLELTVDGEEGSVVFATVADGNNFILNWIGISASDLKNYYLINKENFKSFVSSSNTERLALISRFIKAEQLDNADDIIKEKNKPLEVQAKEAAFKAASIQGEINVYKQQLAAEAERNLEDERQSKIEGLEASMDEVLTRYDRYQEQKKNAELTIKLTNDKIKEFSDSLTQFNASLAKLNNKDFAAQYQEITVKRQEFDKTTLKNRSELDVQRKTSQALSLSIQELQSVLRGTATCPKCKHTFSIVDPNADLKAIAKEITQKQDSCKDISENIALAQKNLEELLLQAKQFDTQTSAVRTAEQENIRNIRALQSDITRIQLEIKRHQGLVANTTKEIEWLNIAIAKCDEESNQLLEAITKAEEEDLTTKEAELEGLITLTEKKLEKACVLQADYEQKIADNVEWGARFKSFKMSLACEQLRIIQNFANLALQKQKSELRLSIDGFKVNAKGKIKEEITVTVITAEGEYKPFWSFSGGERARIEVALIQAFQEMINGTNEWGGLHFLMIDEVLEGTDPLGLSLLLESLNDVGYPVYIISHVMNIRAGAQTLTIIKENGESYIE
jgi:hypothetical protein